ncbi:NADH-quinone oxidoreductase subunit L [SAR202 cluster bacterium AD-802-E10_MRT_200m]|nr:NADH-quinone oxidoreductase subunit L [SAR202 cluster bacterium AD-802-E10_MRT_200m]
MTEGLGWAILILPVFSFVFISFVIRPFLNNYNQWAGFITIACVGMSLGLSLWALGMTIDQHEGLGWASHSWMVVGGLDVRLGILMDPLTAVMLVVVTGISFLVQVYSQGYMANDPGYARYYACMSLFTASMVGLVMASSILQLYVFWELVGLSSYLLIGFWYRRPSASRAAMKAFLVTRLGDLGLLLAILVLFSQQGEFSITGLNSLEIVDIHAMAMSGSMAGATITWIAIGIFAAAAGKSAQFPLHIWLPDAMEGPTPVSALIHAATMVAAGVFLVARFFPVFEQSGVALDLVAVIGAFTAIFAATIAIVMHDIKRVVAYSTISQLGYMMLALGIGAYGLAIFHLFTHAFFKALLFLGAGSVNHATGTFDMRYMGGLRKYQPWTYLLFFVAALSLSGIFPLAGFWSKDEILAEAWKNGDAVSRFAFAAGFTTVFLTSFYIFRVLFLTFHGEFRGGVEVEEKEAVISGTQTTSEDRIILDLNTDHKVHLTESPPSMLLPMFVLGCMSVIGGFIANPPIELGILEKHWIMEMLVPPFGEYHSPTFNMVLAVISVSTALLGIALAWSIYGVKWINVHAITIRPIRTLLVNKYYIDGLYEKVLMGNVFYKIGCRMLDWFDRALIDEVVEKFGWFARNIGRAVSQLQTGQLQMYAMATSVGVSLIVILFYIWG